MNKTSIEWTDFTWNPVTGCNKVSQGCKHCYAETVATRFWGNRKFTDVIMHQDRLHEPAKNKKKWAGKKVFVCSMSDLFHESVSEEFIINVWQVMSNCPETTFQILTKRPERALEWFKKVAPVFFDESKQMKARRYNLQTFLPLPNVWIGTSCENQDTANERIPLLLQIPARVRFLSCEPLLGPIDLVGVNKVETHKQVIFTDSLRGKSVSVDRDTCKQFSATVGKIHWVIVGGESGHGARPMHPEWVRSLRDQCNAANVPFFFKQWGEYGPLTSIGSEWAEYVPGDDTRYLVQGYGKIRYHQFGCGGPSVLVYKVGKSKAGNLLDGIQHLNFPLPTA